MADDMDDWREASPETQLVLFPRLSANATAVLRLMQGPNQRQEAAAALELQARRHDEQLRLMRELFEAQEEALRGAIRAAAREEVCAALRDLDVAPPERKEAGQGGQAARAATPPPPYPAGDWVG